jgi:DNA-binding CsgD family transcriptional regulator
MRRNSYGKTITKIQTLAYILRFVSDGKSEEQIVEIFNGDKQLVKT